MLIDGVSPEIGQTCAWGYILHCLGGGGGGAQEILKGLGGFFCWGGGGGGLGGRGGGVFINFFHFI
jgi:hypothetical protein